MARCWIENCGKTWTARCQERMIAMQLRRNSRHTVGQKPERRLNDPFRRDSDEGYHCYPPGGFMKLARLELSPSIVTVLESPKWKSRITGQQGSRQNKASLGGDIAIQSTHAAACCTASLFGMTASSVCAAQRPAAVPFGGGIVIYRSDCRPGLATLARGAFSEAAPRRGAESNRTVKQRRSI